MSEAKKQRERAAATAAAGGGTDDTGHDITDAAREELARSRGYSSRVYSSIYIRRNFDTYISTRHTSINRLFLQHKIREILPEA